MTPFEIILLIVTSILLVVLVTFFVLYLLNKNKPIKNDDLTKEIYLLETKFDNLSNDLSKEIKISILEEMSKLNEKDAKLSEANNEKLERFQVNITETLQKRFDALNKQMDDKLEAINKKVDEKLAEGFKGTSETLIQVRERLQAIDVAQKNLEELGKDVVSLKGVLEGNQSRGMYGEYQLEMVLHNIFGDTVGCYDLQYVIKKGRDGDVRADAVVFMPKPNNLICIDSKFPFQDYQRMFDAETDEEREKWKKEFANATKKHITTIKDKYIIENKTAQEAIMFIPNDGVFAFIHHELEDVVSYAREKRVILTSPSTLPAILVTINMVRLEVERSKNVALISKELNRLGKEFEMFSREWDQLSRQLELATRSREKLDSRIGKITTRFDSISSSAPQDNLIEEESVIDSIDHIE